ncbi:MAG TPA: hypothetical protein VE173_03015, partial [Longimicrobiales bacterium]|nr:hypothetical protein [Longimicrobiales bacterium]
MRAAGRAALLGGLSFLGSCVYLNAVYNAQRLFEEAEEARWAGRDERARVFYDSVVAKAARGYRKEPDGKWADDALYLLGRAYLRRGEPGEATAALERTLEITDDPDIRAGVVLHLGIAAASAGDRNRALAYLDQALRDLKPGPLLAEGHLWRARVVLESGDALQGWWDLDRAADDDEHYRVPAGLERLRWGFVHGDSTRIREGLQGLLAIREAHVREDSVVAIVQRVAARWGPRAGADLLSAADGAAWPQGARDRLVLARAGLQVEAGEEAAAVAAATAVSRGAGAEASEARLFLARLRLKSVREVEALDEVRALLLPAVGDSRVLEILEAVRMVEILVEKAEAGEGPPEALFAAGELARDELGAGALARALMVRYAGAT